MKHRLLEVLRCPGCLGELSLQNAVERAGEIESGELRCSACRSYPIVDFVPRFVPAENYASNFGLQWNRFSRTQLDSHSGVDISAKRFGEQTGWAAGSAAGEWILDAGCGAGRFAEIALTLGGDVVAIDYSSAVNACQRNLGAHPRLHVVQADIYHLPFRRAAFQRVYSLGVLQHTPDVRAAVLSLPAQLASGGQLVIDVYARRLTSLLHPRFWLRPITRRMSPQVLFGIIQRFAAPLLTLSSAAAKVPAAGRYLQRLVPVANYEGVYPLSQEQLVEWAILDTFDWLAPRYDQPQSAETLSRWLAEAELRDVKVFVSHHLTAQASKS